MRWGAIAVVVGVLAACGGQVGGPGQDRQTGKSCSGSCSEGDTCSAPLTDCQGNTMDQLCTCQNGRFACTHWDCVMPPKEICAQGTQCSAEGAGCMEVGGKECGGYRGVCTCKSGSWSCIEPVCKADGGADATAD